jgi:hypothetical protein
MKNIVMTALKKAFNAFNEALTGPTPEVGVNLGYEYVDLVLNRDGPPFVHEGLLFVEVQNVKGQAVNYGHVVRRDDGHWVIRIPDCRFDKLD